MHSKVGTRVNEPVAVSSGAANTGETMMKTIRRLRKRLIDKEVLNLNLYLLKMLLLMLE